MGGDLKPRPSESGPESELDLEVAQAPYEMPSRATELVVVRHGATEPARQRLSFPLLEGRGDPALTEIGVEQAAAVAAKLGAKRTVAIFVTPLRRTRETAAPLVAVTGLAPVVVPELVEVHLGELEGGGYQIRQAAGDPVVRRVFTEQRWDAIAGAESQEAISARVRTGIDRIVAGVGPGGAAVVFTHGGIVGELCSQATGADPLAMVHADNCSITRLVAFPSGRLLLRSFNDISHLEDHRDPAVEPPSIE